MFSAIFQWFDAQRTALNQRRAQRQQIRNEALWDAMNIAHGTRVVDRLVTRAIERGGDVHATVPPGYARASGETPFTWALHAGRWALALDLLHRGADPYAPTRAAPTLEWRQVQPVGLWGLSPNGSYQGTLPASDLAVVLLARQVMDPMTGAALMADAWRLQDALLARRVADHRPLALCGGSTALHQTVLLDAQLAGWTVERLQPLDVNVRDALGRTPLHEAMNPSDRHAVHHDLGAVKRLLQAGADPYATDLRGHSPLHVLAENVRVGDLAPEWLRDLAKAWPALDWTRPDAQGVTPLTLLETPERFSTWELQPYGEAMGMLRAQRVATEQQTLRSVMPEGPESYNTALAPVTTSVSGEPASSVRRTGRPRL